MRNGNYSSAATNFASTGIFGTFNTAGFFDSWNTNGTQNSTIAIGTYGLCSVSTIQRDYNGTQVAAIQIATATGYAAYTYQGSFGPFTGAHDALIEKNTVFELGDIVVDYELINKLTVNDVITKVKLSSAPKQKSVLGVISGNIGNTVEENSIPTSLAEYSQESNSYVISEVHQTIYNDNDVLSINALGEGCINVCGENGDIEMGDYITTSSMLGKGMKQDDDLLHNYTVAKARENVTFSSPTEVKQIACSYHCG
jgi:aspartokinase